MRLVIVGAAALARPRRSRARGPSASVIADGTLGLTICLGVVAASSKVIGKASGVKTLLTFKLLSCRVDRDMVTRSVPLVYHPKLKRLHGSGTLVQDSGAVV